MEIDDSPVEHISVSVSVYLFAIRGTRERRRRKKSLTVYTLMARKPKRSQIYNHALKNSDIQIPETKRQPT